LCRIFQAVLSAFDKDILDMSQNLLRKNFSTSKEKESNITVNNENSGWSFISLKQPTE